MNNQELIAQIVERASKLCVAQIGRLPEGYAYNLKLTLLAVHYNDSELDLKKLLAFDDFNFCHDIGGIVEHFNMQTLKLDGCFMPRSAA